MGNFYLELLELRSFLATWMPILGNLCGGTCKCMKTVLNEKIPVVLPLPELDGHNVSQILNRIIVVLRNSRCLIDLMPHYYWKTVGLSMWV